MQVVEEGTVGVHVACLVQEHNEMTPARAGTNKCLVLLYVPVSA